MKNVFNYLVAGVGLFAFGMLFAVPAIVALAIVNLIF